MECTVHPRATPIISRPFTDIGQRIRRHLDHPEIQAAVGKARQASSRAVQSVIQYEREHAIVEKAWAGMQQGVRYAGRKVRECTSVDTTTPN